ncbi:MAG TPA: ComF family protein [Thermoclostridium caenicola]|uniref:ComF family protein n=1 Tax=Thermoclostridium caenicola TaxID=659425 RepID=UPI002B74DDFC|nr:ComF family protein [Thermoclostridium caenicola]HOL85105.1 ComF family protein [Thermoclostridium caenicola]HOP73404.1 ComF family protein [Thermoclostridium caenicola]HPO77227.1 ComF family protein [Thermoclostridium caenicola]
MPRTGLLDGPGFWERLLRLLYPEKCVFCGTILPETAKISTCKVCHATLPRYGRGFERAPHIPWVNGLFAAFVYEDMVEQAIHAMKFFGRPRTAHTLAFLMWEEMGRHPMMPDCDLIVPVPMHRRKQLSRGYNQSGIIGQALGEMLDIPVEHALIKTRHTKPQSLSTREERLTNLEDAFRVADPTVVAGRSILLVDDVATTGATLGACARALREAGASWIFAAVIAIAGK